MKYQHLKIFISVLTGLIIFSACAGKNDRPIRILTGGISHESNTFNPILTTAASFDIKRGDEVLIDEEWVRYLAEAGVEVVPTLHANANPFGVVANETYELFKSEIINGARNAIEEGELDGIYLDGGFLEQKIKINYRVKKYFGN